MVMYVSNYIKCGKLGNLKVYVFISLKFYELWFK